MAIHSSVLAWRISRTEEPGGYSPWGHKESDTTEVIQHTQWGLRFGHEKPTQDRTGERNIQRGTSWSIKLQGSNHVRGRLCAQGTGLRKAPSSLHLHQGKYKQAAFCLDPDSSLREQLIRHPEILTSITYIDINLQIPKGPHDGSLRQELLTVTLPYSIVSWQQIYIYMCIQIYLGLIFINMETKGKSCGLLHWKMKTQFWL